MVNDVPYEVSEVKIFYDGGERHLKLRTANNESISVYINNMTDEIPVGVWNTFDDSNIDGLVFYDGADHTDIATMTPTGTVTITGTDGETLTVLGDVDYTDGSSKNVIFYYSGEYVYEEAD